MLGSQYAAVAQLGVEDYAFGVIPTERVRTLHYLIFFTKYTLGSPFAL